MNKYKYDCMTLTASSYNNKITVELSRESTADEVFEAFKTLMLGLTFHKDAFDDQVARYYEEHLAHDRVAGCSRPSERY